MLAVVSTANAGDREARQWLERMSEALATRNYEGRFFHLRDSRSESMRIYHRVDKGKVTERLVSLDGSGREIIRNQAEVICYPPDRRTVLVEKRTDDSTLLAAVPAYNEELEAHYNIERGPFTKALGRRTQVINVTPRDQFRYGYRLWLDDETAMPLKSQLCDRERQRHRADPVRGAEFPRPHSRRQSQAIGIRRRFSLDPTGRAAAAGCGSGRRVGRDSPARRLPADGVAHSIDRRLQRPGAAPGVLGRPGVGVGVHRADRPAGPTHEGPGQGGRCLCILPGDMDGHQVTAVGEVPPVTLEAIAAGVTKDERNKNAPAPTPATPGSADSGAPAQPSSRPVRRRPSSNDDLDGAQPRRVQPVRANIDGAGRGIEPAEQPGSACSMSTATRNWSVNTVTGCQCCWPTATSFATTGSTGTGSARSSASPRSACYTPTAGRQPRYNLAAAGQSPGLQSQSPSR